MVALVECVNLNIYKSLLSQQHTNTDLLEKEKTYCI